MFVARLVVLGTPNDGAALEVDVAPPKLAYGTDAVAGLMREHERDVEPPVHQA